MIKVVVIQVCVQTHPTAATTQLMLTQGYLALNTGILYFALNTFIQTLLCSKHMYTDFTLFKHIYTDFTLL